MPRTIVWLLFVLYIVALLGCSVPAHAAPQSSLAYKRLVIREARHVFGLSAPVAMLAGQIEQESAWRPDVCSAYACGLTQFTEATADDIDKKYQLGGVNRSNPEWAVRAQMLYMRDLYEAYHNAQARDDCERWAFTLSSYNGGYGWIIRDKAICAAHDECDPKRWFWNVEDWSNRAAWAFRENRGYPRRILGITQHQYSSWGRTVSCSI